MNVLQNLMELYNHLPQDSTYRQVAKGILAHLEQMRETTIYDIAELTNSSRTTVWRMVQKMGYRSFSEFRHALQNAVSQYSYYNQILQMPQAETTQQMIDGAAQQLRQNAMWLEQQVTPDCIETLVCHMHASTRISFYRPMHYFTVCPLQINLAMDGKQTGFFCLLPEMLADAQELDEKSLVLMFAQEYSETQDLTPVFSTAHEQGAEIWLINGDNSRYRHFAHFSVLNPPTGARGWSSLLEYFLMLLGERYRKTYVTPKQ